MGDLLIMNKKELRRKSILDLLVSEQMSLEDASKRLHFRGKKGCYLVL
jgi:hypothetical protein